jgi:protein-tyrosine phosphatase
MASILVVCTGNICRSPLAEGFLRELFAKRAGDPRIDVASSGTWGWEGSAAVPESVAVAAERDIDISKHTARRLVPEQILKADLILGMTCEHREAVESMVPDAAARAFTLKELVRLLENLAAPSPGDTRVTPARLAERVLEADALRQGGFEGLPGDLDIVDPLGLPMATFRAVSWEIGEFCSRLVDGLFGKAPAAAAAPVATEEPSS